jgi:4-amino-4-deoxy-L-arabinose transferase-like glycosyltransferase
MRFADRTGWAVLLLLGLCLFLFFHGLNTGELYRNEGLRALVAADFLRSGDWLTPRLYGEPLLTKPPGAYAPLALAGLAVGEVTPWAARLPSAVAATVAVFLVYFHFRRAVGPRGGLVAGCLLPASFMWLVQAPSAEIDMLQLAWVTGAIVCFLRALEANETGGPRRAEWGWQLAALLCVAAGALTKWTAPAFFYLSVVPLLAWRRRLRLLVGLPHLTALTLALLLCAGWAVGVAASVGGEALWDTVSREALQRLSPMHHPRSYPWGEALTFSPLFLAANLPWSAAALFTLRPSFARLWDDRGRRLLQALHCWTWPNLLFWSIVPGHKFRHGLPLQPGLAGLAALVCLAWLTGRIRWPLPRLRPVVVFAGLLATWLIVKLAYVHLVIPLRGAGRDPQAAGERLAAAVPDGETLYLCRVKDEGVMFYYGRPARRVAGPRELPPGATVYCLLTEIELPAWAAGGARPLIRLQDGQGDPIVLAAMGPKASDAADPPLDTPISGR